MRKTNKPQFKRRYTPKPQQPATATARLKVVVIRRAATSLNSARIKP